MTWRRAPPGHTLGRALVWAVLLTACATVPPGKAGQPVVHRIRIEGNHALSTREIESHILTGASGWLPWEAKAYFDPNTWEADLRRIERLYQAHGFYQAQVVRAEVVPLKSGEVDLNVTVEEGQPTRVAEVDVTGLEGLPEPFRKKVLAQVQLKQGEVFREELWTGLKQRLADQLKELGYAAASVSGDVVVETTDQTARVLLKTAPGPRYKFGQVYVVTGRRARIPPQAIVEQAEGAVVPGEWYSLSALSEAQARLLKMGVFGAVRVYSREPQPASGTVPVVVDVREAPFHSIRVGPGFELDPVHEELRALAEYTDRDFFGGLRRFTLRGNVGYAFLPSIYSVLVVNNTSEPSQVGPVGDLSAELQQPDFFHRNLRLTTSLEGARGLDQAYEYWSGRGRVGVIWQPHPSFSVVPSYNYEVDQLSGATGTGTTVPPLVLGCNSPSCIERLAYLEQFIEWDRRDDRYEPTKGYYLSLSLQEAAPALGGNFEYLRVLPDGRYFLSVTPRLTLAARLRLGTLVTPPGEVSPILTRFYSGGNNMRGFGYRRLSPMLALPQLLPGSTAELPRHQGVDGIVVPAGNAREAGQTVAVGGNGLFEASVEARYALVGPLIVATFADMGFVSVCSFGEKPVVGARTLAGLATSEVRCEADPGYLGDNLQYAFGVGLRLKIVVPIRVDLAYRPNIGPPLPVGQLPGQDVVYPRQGTCFGIADRGHVIAGSPEGPCTVTISVGEAF